MEIVKFQIKDKTFEKSFNRSKIKLGTILYIKEIQDGKDVEVSEKEFTGSTKFSVTWIAPSAWAVTLNDIYNPEYSEVLSTQKLLDGIMDNQDVLHCISFKASKLRLEYLYKTNEYENSPLRVIFAITERLKFIESLKEKEVSAKLYQHWEPVIIYHLLTCFDLLGQPESWVDFDSWLTSDKHKTEREKVKATLETGLDNIEFSRALYKNYQEIYGAKKSFLRFIREILPPEARRELFESIKIHTNTIPPSIKTISEDGTESEKEKFLYDIRNNYTHKAKVMHGFDVKSIFGSQDEFSMSFTNRLQEIKETKWINYMTSNWPDTLERIVKIGLAEYLKKDFAPSQKYTQYAFKHKYYRAFKSDNSEKTGANRILFDFKGEEITREYVPEGFPKDFEWATIAEIDKNGTVYPNKNREDLIRPIDNTKSAKKIKSKKEKKWWNFSSND